MKIVRKTHGQDKPRKNARCELRLTPGEKTDWELLCFADGFDSLRKSCDTRISLIETEMT